MITFENITKNFKQDFWAKTFRALDSVNFTIKEGALTGFLGANGAGKTTSIKIMMKFIGASGGAILYGSSLGKTQKDIFSNLGFVPERPYFYAHLTGREFLSFAGELCNVSKSDLSKNIIVWSERFQIAHALDRKIRGYSKGMLQRLGIISAIIHNPKLLILDEPLSGLDPVGRKEIKDSLVELHKQGKTIFFSSHIVSDVEEICENVLVLEKGTVLYDGRVDELISKHMNSDYVIKHNGNITTVSQEQKDLKMRELVEAGAMIDSLNQMRPTLEEIVYKIRGR
jgi:ABC-2 type transport system ATP-binding protein